MNDQNVLGKNAQDLVTGKQYLITAEVKYLYGETTYQLTHRTDTHEGKAIEIWLPKSRVWLNENA